MYLRRCGMLLAITVIALPFLASAQSVCPSLSLGSRGSSVTAAQQILYQAYANFPTPTGYFGPVTQAAVKQWQKEHGISQTGTVGPITSRAMDLCTATPAASVTISTPVQSSDSTATISRTLSRGMRGPDVTALQQFLVTQNLLSADSTTGYFGPLTETAVRTFQSQQGIVSSGTPSTTGYGIVGPRTRATIAGSDGEQGPILSSSSTQTNTGPLSSTLTTNVNANNSQCSYFAMPRPTETCSSGGGWDPLMSGSCQIGWRCNAPTQTQTQVITSQSNTEVQPSAATILEQALGSASCEFNGRSIANGGSVTAYQTASVPFGQTCMAQVRTCYNRTLSGSYQYQACSAQAATSCSNGLNISSYPSCACPSGQSQSGSSCITPISTTNACSAPWGSSVTHGSSVTAYQSSSVAAGSSCVSQSRTCSNGSLGGTYQYQNCTVQSASLPNIALTTSNGTITGEDVIFSQNDTITNTWNITGATSYSGKYTATGCTNSAYNVTNANWALGSASGSGGGPAAPYVGCTTTFTITATNAGGTRTKTMKNTVTVPALSCTSPWGASVSSGSSITAYQSSSVAYGSSCVSQSRACSNGSLGGTYQYQSCTVQSAPASCSNGLSISSYPSCTCPSGQSQSGASCIPIPVASDTIDTLSYFKSQHTDKALEQEGVPTTYFNQVLRSGIVYLMKWGPKSFIKYPYDANYIYFTEEHEMDFDGATASQLNYSFSPGYWMKRYMKIGESIDGSATGNIPTMIQYYDTPHTCNPTATHRYYMKQVLEARHPAMNLGGDLGIQDVIVLRLEQGTYSEKEFYAKGWGLVQWQECTLDGSSCEKTVRLNKISSKPPWTLDSSASCTGG